MTLFELEALLTLDTKDFSNAVTGAEAEGKTLAQRLGADADSIKSAFDNAFSISIGQLMADGFKQALGFAKDFTVESIGMASDMVEIRNQIDTIFGDDASKVYSWAAGATDAFGMSEKAALDYIGTLTGIMKTTGIAEDELMPVSMNLIERLADIASFKNMDFDTVFEKLKSGLRGNTEAVEELGLSVHVATMVEWLGLEKETEFTKGMTQAEQWMARYQYIMEQTDFMEGDFARTSGTFANQIKLFNTNMEELKTTIGDSFLPAATGLLQFMNSLFNAETSVDEETGEMKQTFISAYTEMENTSKNALSLVEKLEELEKNGLNTVDEYQQWITTLQQLETLLPSVSGLIDAQNGSINGGTEALKQNIEFQRSYNLEMASQEMKKSFYDAWAAQKAETEKLEAQYGMMQKEAERQQQQRALAFDMALGYFQEKNPDWQTHVATVSEQWKTDPYSILYSWLNADGSPVAKAFADNLKSAMDAYDQDAGSAGFALESTALWTEYLAAMDRLRQYESEEQEMLAVEQYFRDREKSGKVEPNVQVVEDLALLNRFAETTLDARYGEKPDDNAFTAEEQARLQEIITPGSVYDTMLKSWTDYYVALGERDFGELFQLTDEGRLMDALPPTYETPADSETAEAVTGLTNAAQELITAAAGLKGMSVTLDGDTIIGFVSAGMAREARGSQHTG